MSPVENLPPTGQQIGRKAHREDRRLTDIERRRILTGDQQEQIGGDRFPGFSFPFAAIGDLAPDWEATRDIAYVSAIIRCVAAGGGTGSFRLDLNGAPIFTLSLLTGETRHEYASVFSMSAGSTLGGELTALAGQIIVSVQLVEAS